MQLYAQAHWREREVLPISFFFVWTTFEHQMQEFYASEKVQVFSFAGKKPNCDTSRATNEQVR